MTDGDGRYLHHFTKPVSVKECCDSEDEIEDDTQDKESVDLLSTLQKETEKKPAEIAADKILEWIRTMV